MDSSPICRRGGGGGGINLYALSRSTLKSPWYLQGPTSVRSPPSDSLPHSIHPSCPATSRIEPADEIVQFDPVREYQDDPNAKPPVHPYCNYAYVLLVDWIAHIQEVTSEVKKQLNQNIFSLNFVSHKAIRGDNYSQNYGCNVTPSGKFAGSVFLEGCSLGNVKIGWSKLIAFLMEKWKPGCCCVLQGQLQSRLLVKRITLQKRNGEQGY